MTEENKLSFVPLEEIRRIRNGAKDWLTLCNILSQILRINILYMIKRAGSGHIGASFSAIDIMLWLWLFRMQNPNQPHLQYSDTFFSSKGHDAPALYSILTGLGFLDFGLIHKLRRLNGLPGHPDIKTPFVMTNTGSLGMGISKARGMAIANRLGGKKGRFFVLAGDGELQEGQIWESLQPAANGKFSEITVIVDRNKIQSDMETSKVSELGNLSEKFRAFGWTVSICDGHDFSELKAVFDDFTRIERSPHVIIAETIKGRGVSFMESVGQDGLYRYHSGAPNDEDYLRAIEELVSRANLKLENAGLAPLKLESTDKPAATASGKTENLVDAYGKELLELGGQRNDIVVLDGDLMKDCGLLPFRNAFPQRFIECGIAEQDMVSVAGGLALRGKLPIVHSFACFLSTRPNEQIYNNATEGKKIIYVGSLAGLLPATPGHSHQSVRDISCLGAIPGLTIIQPCNEEETRLALRWAVNENTDSTYIRLVSVPQELNYALPHGYQLRKGCGVKLKEGVNGVIIAYGPVMLRQAMIAAQELEEGDKISMGVFNFPWLNFVDGQWFEHHLGHFGQIFVLDDHYVTGGLGELIASSIAERLANHAEITLLGLKEIPTCGQNDEALQYHGLNAKFIASLIKKKF